MHAVLKKMKKYILISVSPLKYLKTILLDKVPVYWFYKIDNFGDVLNKYLVERISNRKAICIHPGFYLFQNFFVIGSILHSTNKNSNVWGSGFMSSDSIPKAKPKKVHAVRGPLSYHRYKELNIDCPQVYGDPALLLPKFYNPKDIKKKYDLGVIPHYIDKNSEYIERYKNLSNVKIIDIQNTNIEGFVNELLECNHIISSSLHGIIVGDAYNIPSKWIRLSEKVKGGDFKFRDYFASVSREFEDSVVNRDDDIKDILNSFKEYKINLDTDKLLSVCPFRANLNE